MDKRYSIVFSSAVQATEDLNQSLARGTMRVAYHGENRKKSFISKETYEQCMHTIYNRPIVCHYMRESDTIGGHDVAVESGVNGLQMYNITEPVGMVPESARTWWETVVEPDGKEHEYLCVDIVLWKRQQAYRHLMENGITDESMEIDICDSAREEDGLLHIYKFEFTAFCLLERDAPCFESARIDMFSLAAQQETFSLMMDEFRKDMQEYYKVITASADDIPQHFSKGGNLSMNFDELLNKYSLSAEDIDFETDGMELSDIEERMIQIAAAKQGEPNGEPEEPEVPEVPQEPAVDPIPAEPSIAEKQVFSLTAEQFAQELRMQVYAERVEDPYFGGTMPRFWIVDYDAEAGEVYVVDVMDDRLYGLPFSMNGDQVVVDFAAARRKKYVFADFEEGSMDQMNFSAIRDMREDAKTKFDGVQATCNQLQVFHDQTLSAQRAEEENKIFSMFSDLSGNEAFESLRGNCADMTLEQLEDKCYSIRGRSQTMQFSADPVGSVRIPVEKAHESAANEPYGGVFTKYGIGNR